MSNCRFGGVDVEENGWTLERYKMRQVVRVVVGIALFVLATGVWVYLWVPPF
jgi:uncharacterized membrane protein YozB (DUF420 family)